MTLAACGHMVEQALAAADLLAADGISAAVIDVASVKPLDEETILTWACQTKAIVTCEEHSVIGGLGSAIAELLGETAPVVMERVGVKDVFGTSGEAGELLEYFGLTAPHIAAAARRVVSRKS